MENSYQIGNKKYTREELYMIGREHYPRLYYIPISIGIIFLCIGLFIELIVGVMTIIFASTMEPDFPIWVFYIPLGVFGLFILVGIILIVVGACGRSKEKYIRYGYNYVLKATDNGQNQNVVRTNKQMVSDEQLARYQRLLKGGVITQEEYDKKVQGM